MDTKNNNNIGLNIEKSKKVAENLNDLLSNYQLFYMNLRGFHWNIKGKKFFELHLKFEELYNDALIKVDEIAERILTLSETPFHSFKKYLDTTEIKAAENIKGLGGITLQKFQENQVEQSFQATTGSTFPSRQTVASWKLRNWRLDNPSAAPCYVYRYVSIQITRQLQILYCR